MDNGTKYSKLLLGERQLGPYPMEKLTRVDKPTTLVTDDIKRFDESEQGIARLRRGDFGAPDGMPPIRGSTPSIGMALMSAPHQSEPGQGPMGPPPPARGAPPPGGTDAQALARQAAAVMSGESAPEKVSLPDDPAVLSRHIKSMAYFAGADVVGICELPPWAVYARDSQGNPVECNHKYAICIALDQGRNTMEASDGNDWISMAQSGRGYAMCGFIGGTVASYIKMMGYPSHLHSIRSYQVIVPPLLMLSGIGELSRANIVLNPFLGLRFKASVVTTDLPLAPDKPVDFGLQDFCNKCMKCAELCPSHSISTGDKVMRNGYENWEFNAETCTRYRFRNPKGVSCGKCIRVCPWNKPEGWTHDLVRWMVEHTPYMNDFFIKMDDVMGYGKPASDKKWWFDPV